MPIPIRPADVSCSGHVKGLHSIRMDDTDQATISYRIMMDCQRPAATRIPAPDQDLRHTAGQVSGKSRQPKSAPRSHQSAASPDGHQPNPAGGSRLSTFEGARGSRLASRRHAAAASRQSSHISTSHHVHNFCDTNGSLRADPQSRLRDKHGGRAVSRTWDSAPETP
jgi:hypothetical protein